MQVELRIVIVNWNGGEYLERCIRSLTRFPPSVSFEIVVVDNASSDQSMDWVRAESRLQKNGATNGLIRLIENPRNLGFSKANNQAFVDSNAGLVLLLNNDAEVTENAIDSLVQTIRSQPHIGACGPRLLNSDGSLQVSVWRNPPTAWEILVSGLRLYKLLPRKLRGRLLLGKHWDHSRRRSVGMLSGACILLKREVLERLGGFDERFHMYAEDNELCLRILRAGWEIVFEPSAVVIHHGAKSALARWSSLERQIRILNEYLRFQKCSLTRPQFVLNLLANSLVLSLAWAWKGVTAKPTSEVRMKLSLCGKHLREVLFAGNSQRFDRAEQEPSEDHLRKD